MMAKQAEEAGMGGDKDKVGSGEDSTGAVGVIGDVSGMGEVNGENKLDDKEEWEVKRKKMSTYTPSKHYNFSYPSRSFFTNPQTYPYPP